ncbi:hypothetical protein CM15mP43_10170 [bacterium]|nr:MAG: hypothetical protein CM15mP43_10170 [bacterium]
MSKYASFSSKSLGRIKKEKKCFLRTDFQRDRDRILHSKPFLEDSKIKHKFSLLHMGIILEQD